MKVMKVNCLSNNAVSKLNPVKKACIKNSQENFFKFDTPIDINVKDIFLKQEKIETITSKITELFY